MEHHQLPPQAPKIEIVTRTETKDNSLNNAPTLDTSAQESGLSLKYLDMMIARTSKLSDQDQRLKEIIAISQKHDKSNLDLSGLNKSQLLAHLMETKQRLYGSVVPFINNNFLLDATTRFQNLKTNVHGQIKPILAQIPLVAASTIFPYPEGKSTPYEGNLQDLLNEQKIIQLSQLTNQDYTKPKYPIPKNVPNEVIQTFEESNVKWAKFNKDTFIQTLKNSGILDVNNNGALAVNNLKLEQAIRDRTQGVGFIGNLGKIGLLPLAKEYYRGGPDALSLTNLAATVAEHRQNINPEKPENLDHLTYEIMPGVVFKGSPLDEEYLNTDLIKKGIKDSSISPKFQIPYQEIMELSKKLGLKEPVIKYQLENSRGWADNDEPFLENGSLTSVITINPRIPFTNIRGIASNEQRECLGRIKLILNEFAIRLDKNPGIKSHSPEWQNLLNKTIKETDGSESNLVLYEELQLLTWAQDILDMSSISGANEDFRNNLSLFSKFFFTEAETARFQAGEINSFADLNWRAQDAFLYTKNNSGEYVNTLNNELNEAFKRFRQPNSSMSKMYKNGLNLDKHPEKTESMLKLMNEMTRNNGIEVVIEINPAYVAGSDISPIIARLPNQSETDNIDPAYKHLRARNNAMKVFKNQVDQASQKLQDLGKGATSVFSGLEQNLTNSVIFSNPPKSQNIK